MSYSTHGAIATNYPLRLRVTAAAAQEGVTDPPRWTNAVIWSLVGSDWIAAWESWEAAHQGHADTETPGDDPAVITDAMILASVAHAMMV